MGIFGRRFRQPAPVPEPLTWVTDGTAVQPGGDIGGDIQDGESYSVRYVRPDLPGSLITVTFYGCTNEERNPGEWWVQEQTEFMVCEDPAGPGGTEIWSEVTYGDVSALVIDSQAEAEQEARAFADAALGDASTHGWDGQPDWSRGGTG